MSHRPATCRISTKPGRAPEPVTDAAACQRRMPSDSGQPYRQRAEVVLEFDDHLPGRGGRPISIDIGAYAPIYGSAPEGGDAQAASRALATASLLLEPRRGNRSWQPSPTPPR